MKSILFVLLLVSPAAASPISYAYTGHKSYSEMESILLAAPGQRILLFESDVEGQFVASCDDEPGFDATVQRRCDEMLLVEELGNLTRVWLTLDGLRRMDGCRVQFDGEQYAVGGNAVPVRLDHSTMVPLVVGHETRDECTPTIRVNRLATDPGTPVPEPSTGVLLGASLALFLAASRMLKRA